MTQQTTFPIPAWVGTEDRQRFVVTLAALYHNPTGSVSELSLALGLAHSTLNASINGNGIQARTCLALEALLGAEQFPREFFRPDLFPAAVS